MNLEMSEYAVVGKRYSLVLPKAIRRKLQIDEGQRVLIRVEGNQVVIEPLPKDPYAVLERVIGEPYDERKDEPKAYEWLKKHARS